MKDVLVRMLDESFQEFDRLMEKTLEEINTHTELARDYEVLVARHQAARLAGGSFVGEASMALADLDGRLDALRKAAA